MVKGRNVKKTICLVTDWYPTKENPFVGQFFKEQAFAMASEFNFVIFRYQEKISINPFKTNEVYVVNREGNTVEYRAIAYVPIWIRLTESIYNKIKRNTIDGIGKYVSPCKQNWTRRQIGGLFEKTGRIADVFYCVDAQTEAFNLECLSQRYNKPYVIGEHGVVPWPGSLIADANKNAIERADLFLAISNDKIRQILMQNIKLPKTIYLGNLIDEEKFVYKAKKEKHIRTFVIVAAHSFYKNYDMFVQVMDRLTEITKKDFRVMVVGYGANKGYSKNVAELEDKIHQSKFANKAELIPAVLHEDMGDIFNRADAFVMTSIQEGQPVSAMEAACCGLPIFSTRCGGVEDYVDETMGRIYDVLDVEGMANGLNSFLNGQIAFDPIYIREKVIALFGRERFTREFANAFLKVIR